MNTYCHLNQNQAYLMFGCHISQALAKKFKKRGRMARQLHARHHVTHCANGKVYDFG